MRPFTATTAARRGRIPLGCERRSIAHRSGKIPAVKTAAQRNVMMVFIVLILVLIVVLPVRAACINRANASLAPPAGEVRRVHAVPISVAPAGGMSLHRPLQIIRRAAELPERRDRNDDPDRRFEPDCPPRRRRTPFGRDHPMAVIITPHLRAQRQDRFVGAGQQRDGFRGDGSHFEINNAAVPLQHLAESPGWCRQKTRRYPWHSSSCPRRKRNQRCVARNGSSRIARAARGWDQKCSAGR